MSDQIATCLRCDWQGDGVAGTPCPECGAAVFAPAKRDPKPAPEQATEPASSGSRATDAIPASGPKLEAQPKPGRVRAEAGSPGAGGDPLPMDRSRALRRAPLVVLTVVVIVAAFAVVRNRSPKSSPAGASRFSGALVYAAASGEPGPSRLYRWDLSTNQVSTGPLVDGLETLVKADPIDQGWVGIVAQLPSGQLEASVLRLFGADSQPDALLTGTYVAFDAQGVSVAAAEEGPTTRACRHRLTITSQGVVMDIHNVGYERTVCFRVNALQGSGPETYFTRQRGNSVTISTAARGELRPLLRGYALMSVSPSGDMLVVPQKDVLGFAMLAPPVPGASGRVSLYPHGSGKALISYSNGKDTLYASDVLAWSPDGSTALVSGRLDTVQGIFELAVGTAPAGTSPRLPRLVGSVAGPAWACYTQDGTAFVSTGGALYSIQGHRLTPLPPPTSAPDPSGPLACFR